MMVRGVAVLAVAAAFAVASCGCGMAGDGVERRIRLPASLPADVPLPEGAHLRSVRDLGEKGLTLVFETKEPVASVEGRMRSRLSAGGWTLLSEVVIESAVFSSYRNRGRSVAIGVSRTGAVTVIGLAYRQPESDAGGIQG